MDTSAETEAENSQRQMRRIRTLQEKLQILKEAAAPGASVAAVARKHDMNANLLFGWRRLHARGLLEAQRHAPPLLPVRITSPTITPTQRASAGKGSARRRPRASPSEQSGAIEIIFGDDTRVRLLGEAASRVLAQILTLLPRR